MLPVCMARDRACGVKNPSTARVNCYFIQWVSPELFVLFASVFWLLLQSNEVPT